MNHNLFFLIIFSTQGLLFLSAMAATSCFFWRLGHLALTAARTPNLKLSDLRSTAVWHLKNPLGLAAAAWLIICLLSAN